MAERRNPCHEFRTHGRGRWYSRKKSPAGGPLYNSESPKPAEIALVVDAIAKNMVSVRMPDTMPQAPGGGHQNANAMPGQTYLIESANKGITLLSDHEAKAAANVTLERGGRALQRTPFLDTPGSRLVGDRPLEPSRQALTDAETKLAKVLGPLENKGPANAHNVEISAPVSRETRHYGTMKTPQLEAISPSVTAAPVTIKSIAPVTTGNADRSEQGVKIKLLPPQRRGALGPAQ